MLPLNFAFMEIGRFLVVFQNDTITTTTCTQPQKKEEKKEKKRKSFLQVTSPIGLILRQCKLKEQACNIN